MTTGPRVTPGLVHEVLDALERHGYYRSDDLHADRAIGLIGDLAGIYEGTQDHPSGSSITEPPREARPVPASPGIVVLSPGEVRTVIAALDDASVYKQNRVEMCMECDDRSCESCQWRLQVAGTYDLLATDLDKAAQAWRAAASPSSARPPEPAADREAGQ
jgi:hypothetical protein